MNIAVITGASSGLGKCYVDAVLKLNKYDNYISIEMKKGNSIEKIKEILNYTKGVFK